MLAKLGTEKSNIGYDEDEGCYHCEVTTTKSYRANSLRKMVTDTWKEHDKKGEKPECRWLS